jgi:DNA-binding GntR family transcriptional regulator
MEPIEMLQKIRDAVDAVIKAMESEDVAEIERAYGEFILTIAELGLLK